MMRRFILVLCLILAACRAGGAADTQVPISTPIAVPPTTAPAVTPSLTATRAPTASATLTDTSVPPTASATLAASATTTATDLPQVATLAEPPQAGGFSVRFHPDGSLYVGDQISFEVIAPQATNVDNDTVTAEFPTANGDGKAEIKFGRHGIAGRAQADMLWVWDTSGLTPGKQTIQYSITPNGPTWTETVTLLPVEQLPAREAQAKWQTVSNNCCKVSFVTGSLAQKDLEDLLTMIDQQATDASQKMGIPLGDPIPIVLIPRVLGHGGFASNAITVSYLERDYMDGDKATVIHHEIIHILDARMGGDLRPSMLVEGLAVYETGGHFKPEPLLPRAAALLPAQPGCVNWSASLPASTAAEGCGLDQFIPLQTLADNFYFQQHETGYLEAGALIQYMVNTWGWPAYNAFYRDIHQQKDTATLTPQPGTDPSRAMEAALEKHFGLGLNELEMRFKAALQSTKSTPADAEDLRLSLLFFNTARRYQQEIDPSAYFLTAWLLDSDQMQKRHIVADYMRRPAQPENIALEAMLTAAGIGLKSSNFAEVDSLLAAAGAVLDAYPQQGLQAFTANPLAADYLALTQMALAQGDEAQLITIEKNTARMLAFTSEPGSVQMVFSRQANGWKMQPAAGSPTPQPPIQDPNWPR